jgi:hypothetical protein
MRFNEMATDNNIKNQYASALVSTKDYKTKTSELDLSDRAQVAMHAQIGIQDKQLLDEAVREYNILNVKLIAQIKTHLNHMQKKFIAKEYGENSLSFQRPAMYLSSLEDGEVKGEMPITTANDYLAYSFLMFREVSGNSAYNFQPNFVVSFQTKSTAAYSKADLLNTFKYQVEGEQVQAFISGKNNKKAPNLEALKILKEDKTEVEGILKNTFAEYAHSCNLLKSTTDQNARLACVSFSDAASPDHFLELHTCLEIFNLAKNPALCGEIVYEEFDWSEL